MVLYRVERLDLALIEYAITAKKRFRFVCAGEVGRRNHLSVDRFEFLCELEQFSSELFAGKPLNELHENVAIWGISADRLDDSKRASFFEQ